MDSKVKKLSPRRSRGVEIYPGTEHIDGPKTANGRPPTGATFKAANGADIGPCLQLAECRGCAESRSCFQLRQNASMSAGFRTTDASNRWILEGIRLVLRVRRTRVGSGVQKIAYQGIDPLGVLDLGQMAAVRERDEAGVR